MTRISVYDTTETWIELRSYISYLNPIFLESYSLNLFILDTLTYGATETCMELRFHILFHLYLIFLRLSSFYMR